MGDNRMPQVETICELPSQGKTWTDLEYLKNEIERRKTYTGWPLTFVNPTDLAKAGFFYLKDSDRVQCIFCRGKVGDWEEGDQPMYEHSRHFPYCPFIRNLSVGNISEGNAPDIQQTTGYDVAGHYDFTAISANCQPERNNNTPKLPGNLQDYGILAHRSPKHPGYAGEHARLHSFSNWAPALNPQPVVLAKAGFFYMEVSDHVKCFFCDGGLCNWNPSDDPWVEHAKWFPKCDFLELSKGREFIQDHSVQNAATGGNCTAELSPSNSQPETFNGINHEQFSQTLQISEGTSQVGRPSGKSVKPAERKTPSVSVDPAKGDEDFRLCKICMDEDVGVVFLPCGHLVSCVNCALALKVCPLCRQDIQGTVRTYLS